MELRSTFPHHCIGSLGASVHAIPDGLTLTRYCVVLLTVGQGWLRTISISCSASVH